MKQRALMTFYMILLILGRHRDTSKKRYPMTMYEKYKMYQVYEMYETVQRQEKKKLTNSYAY